MKCLRKGLLWSLCKYLPYGQCDFVTILQKTATQTVMNSITGSLQGYSITSAFSSQFQIKTLAVLFFFFFQFHSLKYRDMNFQHGNRAEILQFLPNASALHLQTFARCSLGLPLPCPGVGLNQCHITALCKHQPQEDQPHLVSSEPQKCPELFKKCNSPLISNLGSYSVPTDTSTLKKVVLHCSVLTSASAHLHFICMHLHASATWFIMTSKGLTRGAGGKQPSCKRIFKRTQNHSRTQPERDQQAGRER